MVQLSNAIDLGVATLGWNARPAADWVWLCFDYVGAWVHPDWAGEIIGVTEEEDDTYSTLVGE